MSSPRKAHPIRHPESEGCALRDEEPHFGPAARAVFNHAAYTFTHFVQGDDYKWIALACLHHGGVSMETVREVARIVGLDLEDRC